jgi:hypothetical protein
MRRSAILFKAAAMMAATQANAQSRASYSACESLSLKKSIWSRPSGIAWLGRFRLEKEEQLPPLRKHTSKALRGAWLSLSKERNQLLERKRK